MWYDVRLLASFSVTRSINRKSRASRGEQDEKAKSGLLIVHLASARAQYLYAGRKSAGRTHVSPSRYKKCVPERWNRRVSFSNPRSFADRPTVGGYERWGKRREEGKINLLYRRAKSHTWIVSIDRTACEIFRKVATARACTILIELRIRLARRKTRSPDSIIGWSKENREKGGIIENGGNERR